MKETITCMQESLNFTLEEIEDLERQVAGQYCIRTVCGSGSKDHHQAQNCQEEHQPTNQAD